MIIVVQHNLLENSWEKMSPSIDVILKYLNFSHSLLTNVLMEAGVIFTKALERKGQRKIPK